jgi:hypothetical protein
MAFYSSTYNGVDVNLLTLCRACLSGQSAVIAQLHQLPAHNPTVRCSLLLQSFVTDVLPLPQLEICSLFISKMAVSKRVTNTCKMFEPKVIYVPLYTAVLHRVQ